MNYNLIDILIYVLGEKKRGKQNKKNNHFLYKYIEDIIYINNEIIIYFLFEIIFLGLYM